MAQNRLDPDQIESVDHGSDGSGQAGRAGRRRRSTATLLRGGTWGKLAGLGQDCRSGVNSTRAWVREVRHAMHEPPRASAGLGRALGSKSSGGGGSARQRSPACCSRAVLGSALGVRECGCVRRARTSQNRARAGLCCAAGSPPRRSCGVCHRQPVFRPLERPTCQDI